MSYIIDRTIQSYIDDERDRCAKLIELLADEPGYLMYCIRTPVHPDEIDGHHRSRYVELQPVPDEIDPVPDDLADLM
jgi:hypothetical protein